MLHVHRAERATELVQALAAVLTVPAGDPFTPEVVAVPSRGIERWLAQRLSNVLGTSPGRADGVCANVEFPFPGRLVGAALQAATGIDPGRSDDPWSPGRAAWPLLTIIDEHIDDTWMTALSTHLGGRPPNRADRPANGRGPVADDDSRRSRRFATARRLADLFDRYGFHRPAMVTAWASGDDVDARGSALGADVAWQVTLWRLLRARIGLPSPAERLGPACDRLRAEPDLVELPPRVSLYGLTRLAVTDLDVLAAVATAREVHLFLLHPSPVLWNRERSTSAVSPSATVHPVGESLGSPLLATWGRDARSMQGALAAHAAGFEDRHHGIDLRPDTLLRRLQTDVRDDVAPPGRPPPGGADGRMPLAPDDASVQIHSCYGRARQVEVLRDAIGHLLADDPTLEPRDLIVMCPDIETFAPLIQATFGPVDAPRASGRADPMDAGTTQLEVRLADRALRQTNPVLATLAALLELAPTRHTASQLIDLAGLEPVRRRFRFDDDELARIEDWVEATGIRWGLDAADRAPYQLERLGTHTWRAGLDRLLVGVSMTEDDLALIGGVLPFDDVDSGDIDLAGRLAELVDRVDGSIAALTTPQTLASWVAAIGSAVDALTSTSARDAWQRRELDRILDGLVADGGDDATVELSLIEVRSLLGEQLRGRPSRANFRTGHLTVCTLVPMRAVPHRVVCLLGLDDGSFPRHRGPDGDDILARRPEPGDHDVRSEDRQLLLDALLAAGEHLVVTYGGHDERTNAERPPAVPIGELLDVIDATAIASTGPAAGAVLTHHPLQPFDTRNFEPGALTEGRAWSFDADALAGARAQCAHRVDDPPFLPAPLAPVEATLVDLDDLVRFVQHPTRAFLRQRLGVGSGDDDEEPADRIPIRLDALQRWGLGERLLAARVAGVDPARTVAAEQARGLLPPLALGQSEVDEVWPQVEAIAARAATVTAGGAPRTADVRVDLGDAGLVAGSVAGLHGSTLLSTTFSRVAPRHRLAAWVRLLALAAAHPDESFDAVTIGRAGRQLGVASIRPVTATFAVEQLGVLVALYRRGMREPLPIYTRTSEMLVRKPAAARREWETTDTSMPKEDREPEHRLRFGRVVSFTSLLAESAPAEAAGSDAAPTSDALTYAHLLWDGLLDHEERSWPW